MPSKNYSIFRAHRGLGGHAALLCGFVLLAQCATAHGTRAQDVGAATAAEVNVKATLSKSPTVGENALQIAITDSKGAAIKDAKVTVSVAITSMDMGTTRPKVTNKGDGTYSAAVNFSMAGPWRVVVRVETSGHKALTKSFDFQPKPMGGDGMQGMEGMQMKANLGDWPANREGSGTSWQPDSSPMFMKMLPSLGGFDLSTMGTIQAGYVDAGGNRGGKGFFSDSMIMLMGRKDLGGGTLGLDFMTSLDPIINGEDGVPDLFQTGETAHGVPLVDRQHPHNIFSELAASYSHSLTKEWTGFIYGGPVGEPALGNVMFLHRASGFEIPEAPISHHWFDSTHISFGVATLGLVYNDKWKFEGSVFNGHEPGENRYTIGPEGLNSASGRFSYNPCRDWSFSTSYGYLSSPEALSPGVNEHRLTFSAAYSHELPHGDNLSATAYFGQNIVEGSPTKSDAWLAEATYYHAKEGIFTRFERVDKDELYNVPTGNYTINKLLFGDVHNFYSKDQLDYGLGAYAGVYSFPSSLDPFYGKSPFTFGVFLRVRPSKM